MIGNHASVCGVHFLCHCVYLTVFVCALTPVCCVCVCVCMLARNCVCDCVYMHA